MQSVIEVAEAVRARARTAESVMVEAFDIIERENHRINAFVCLNEDGALQEARKLDRKIELGEEVGTLAGVPFGVKDLELCAGFPTSYGSLIYKDGPVATKDPVHIARLRAADAIPVGMMAASEFGMDSVTHTPAWGTTLNPWNLKKTPGGSSGGSAAGVSAGMVPFATGTDIGGSIRAPAANCGLVGLKSSMGRIPRSDGKSTFNCYGVLTTTVRDTARLLDVMAGPDDSDRMSLPRASASFEQATETLNVAGLKAVWSSSLGYMPVDPEIELLCFSAAMKLIDSSNLRHVETPVTFPNVYESFLQISFDELRSQLEQERVLPDRVEEMSKSMRQGLERFPPGSASQLIRAHNDVQNLANVVAGFFATADVLLTPVTPVPPFKAEGRDFHRVEGVDITDKGAENFPLWANACWNPSISVPAGITEQGLPVGLLITVRRHRDDQALRLARLYEQAIPWPRLAPGFPASN